jgi:dolichol-phosphate mannosyltransferase
MRGLISELASNQAGVPYARENVREAGESKFPLRQLIRLAMHGIFTHSVAPLRIASYLGIFVALVAASISGAYLFAWGFAGKEWPSGFATTTVLILFGISLNAVFLGIIGEYVGRIYTQVRKRPTVIIEQAINIHE